MAAVQSATLKRCTKCGRIKPSDEFGQDVRRQDGRFPWCKLCRRRPAAVERQADAATLATIGRRRCTQCSQSKPFAEFYTRSATARPLSYCRACAVAVAQRYYRRQPDKVREKGRRYRVELKACVLAVYGDVCSCPGCGATEDLTIDHVNGNGRQHREQLFGNQQRGGAEFYRWAIANDFPDDLATLCRPCNTSKGPGDCCRLDHGVAA